MSLARIKSVLETTIKDTLDAFETYCNGADILYGDEIRKIVEKVSNKDGKFEFTFLLKDFCIIPEYTIEKKYATLRTYRIDINMDNYPNRKLIVVPELDILVSEDGLLFFKNDKQKALKDIKISSTFIREFNKEYTVELYQQLLAQSVVA